VETAFYYTSSYTVRVLASDYYSSNKFWAVTRDDLFAKASNKDVRTSTVLILHDAVGADRPE